MMKYLCLLTLMILFYACSTKVPEHLYKIHENCFTEQNAIEVANAYWVHKFNRDISALDRYTITVKEEGYHYIVYYVLKPIPGYAIRGGASIAINKNDCNVIYAPNYPPDKW